MDLHRFGCALIASATWSAIPAAATGPVILIGDVPETHAPTTAYRVLLEAALDNVTNLQVGIYALGVDAGSPAASYFESLIGGLPATQPIKFLNDDQLSVEDLGVVALLYVPSGSDFVEGGISADETSSLNDRAADIASFLDGGGAVMAFSPGLGAPPLGFLGDLAPSGVVIDPPSGLCEGVPFDNVTLTPEGEAFELDEVDLDGCCWRTVFTEFPEVYLPLATADVPCPILDGSVAAMVAFLTPPPIDFGEPLTFPAAGEPRLESVGDLDGDSTVDVAALIPATMALESGSLQIFLNQGTDESGWLGLTPNDPVEVGVDPSGLTVGLFDTNTSLDVAVANFGDNSITVLLNTGNGDGTFQRAATIDVGTPITDVSAGDFNVDGFIDLLAAASGGLILLIGDGTGDFAVPLPFGGLPGFFPTVLITDDFDDDKCLDAGGVAGGLGAGNGFVFVQLGEPGGGFGPATFYPIGNDPSDLTAADFNTDGSKDIIASNLLDDTVSILVNMGDGLFFDAFELPVGTTPRSVDSDDLDQDGKVDLVVVAGDIELGPSVQILRNTTGGSGFGKGDAVTFDTPFAIPIPDGPNFVTTADFNQDELQDLVTVNSAAGAGTVSVILNEQPTEDACPADLNDDGFVNISDLLVLLTAWGPCPDDEPCPADLNQDGVVGVVDLLILIFSFGPCPL